MELSVNLSCIVISKHILPFLVVFLNLSLLIEMGNTIYTLVEKKKKKTGSQPASAYIWTSINKRL